MKNNGIEIMETRYKKTPFIKKPIDSHGGNGVVMCDNLSDYDDNFVCQKPASDLGRDLRVWVVGKKIITSIFRENKNDFRSNYCLGGTATPYELSSDERALTEKIISLVDGDYYGIDFVFHKSKIVFNELEDTVGARMVYDKTNIDILKHYCDHIKSNID